MSAVEQVRPFVPRPAIHKTQLRPIVIDAALDQTSVHAIDDQMVAITVRDEGAPILHLQIDAATSRMLVEQLTAVNDR